MVCGLPEGRKMLLSPGPLPASLAFQKKSEAGAKRRTRCLLVQAARAAWMRQGRVKNPVKNQHISIQDELPLKQHGVRLEFEPTVTRKGGKRSRLRVNPSLRAQMAERKKTTNMAIIIGVVIKWDLISMCYDRERRIKYLSCSCTERKLRMELK